MADDNRQKGQEGRDPRAWGYVEVPNYFLDFWQPLLGARAAALYILLRRFAYGGREECWPTLSRLAASLGMDRRALHGRGREREGVKSRDAGLFARLQEAGLARVSVTGEGRARRYRCWVCKRIPLLSPAQVARLQPRLQAAHERLLSRWEHGGERRPPGEVWPRPLSGAGLPLRKNMGNKLQEKKVRKEDIGVTKPTPREGGVTPAREEASLDPTERIWQLALDRMRRRMPGGALGMMMGGARLLSLKGGVALIGVTPFAWEQIQRRGGEEAIQGALAEAAGREMAIEWVISPRGGQSRGNNGLEEI